MSGPFPLQAKFSRSINFCRVSVKIYGGVRFNENVEIKGAFELMSMPPVPHEQLLLFFFF